MEGVTVGYIQNIFGRFVAVLANPNVFCVVFARFGKATNRGKKEIYIYILIVVNTIYNIHI